MAKAKASVSVSLPAFGEEAQSAPLELAGGSSVVLSAPAVELRPGKHIYLNLEGRKEGRWYPIRGSGRRVSATVKISDAIALPVGTDAVRVCAFSDVEASASAISGEATLTAA